MKPRLTFIINKKIKHKKQIIKDIENVFADYHKILVQTDFQYHAIDLVERLSDSTDVFVAVGGDGTINEVVNGIMLLPQTIKEKVWLGILPAGTGNDFARSLGITSSALELRKLIEDSTVEKIDVGKADYTTEYGKKAIRYFVNIAEVGIGAETVRLIDGSHKLLGSALSFMAATLQVFLTYKYPYVRLNSDSVQWQGRMTLIAFANSKYFGGGLGIAPDADPQSGYLQLVLVEKVSMSEFLRNVQNLRNAKRLNHEKIHYYNTKHLTIETIDKKQAVFESDGEYLGTTPVEISILPKSINILWDKKSK